MATLPALQAASPLDASDDNRLTFTADLTEVLSRALDDTPADLTSMDTLSWQVEYRVNTTPTDDTYDLNIRIVNGATILAAADAAGTFSSVATSITSTTDTTSSVTAFAYVNTGASKTTWDGASVELQQVYSKTKGADNVSIEVDFTEFTGTYTQGTITTPQSVSGSLTPSGSLVKLVITAKSGSTTATGSIQKQVNTDRDGSITSSGTVSTKLVSELAISGAITATGDLLKSILKINTGQTVLSGDISKFITKGLAGSITLSGANQKRVESILDGSLTPTGTVITTFVAMISVAGSLTVSGIVNTLFVPAGTVTTWVRSHVKGVKSIVTTIFVSSKEERRD